MKRIRMFLSMLLIFVCTFGAGCFEYGMDYTQGVSIDNYEPALSSVGVTTLIPDGFQTEYKYADGKFYWDAEWNENYLNLIEKIDRSLMWLSFEETEYKEAKNRILVESISKNYKEKEYNGYQFYIMPLHGNLGNLSSECRVVSYNDQKCTLIFMGMWCTKILYPKVEYMSTDFGLYLKTFFGDFYDFDA